MGVNWQSVNVEENGREMEVLIPDMGDRSETKDLTDFAIGKTKEDLRKKVDKEPMFKDKKDKAAFLKDIKKFDDRRKSDHPRKYF
jgi:hypothetical protein